MEDEGTNPLRRPAAGHSFTATSQSLFVEEEASARQTGRLVERVSSGLIAATRSQLRRRWPPSFGGKTPARALADFARIRPEPHALRKKTCTWGISTPGRRNRPFAADHGSTQVASQTISAASATAPRLLTNDDLATSSRAERETPDLKSKPISYCRFDAKHRQLVDFQLPDIDGRAVRFQDTDADLILLDFWGTWCDPCLKSIPHLVELQNLAQTQQGPKAKKLKIIGIACEQGANADRIAKVKRPLRSSGSTIKCS